MKRAFMRVAAVLVLTAACESPSGSSPLTVSIIGPDRQGTVGETFGNPVIAVIKDASGHPASNRTVTWTVLTEGGGTVSAATSTTNGKGEATTKWTLGTRAGVHELRASAGSGTATLRATALAGPATTAAIVNGDSVHTLDPGQSVQVALTAADRYGNPVPGSAITALWGSRDGAVAGVSGGATGTITGQQPGRTVIDVAAPGTALRVYVTVRGLAQAVFPLDAWVTTIHGGGGRILASTLSPPGRRLWERTTGGWAQVAGVEAWEGRVRVLPSGEGWAGGAGSAGFGVYRSAAAGSPWTPVAAPFAPNALTSHGSTVFIAQYSGGLAQTAARWDGAAWTPISSPAAADSTVGIGSLAAGAPDELVMGGIVQQGDVTRPYLARWNGTTTTRIPMPTGIAYGTSGQVVLLAASAPGRAYAVLIPDFDVSWKTTLLFIDGNVATRLANPLEPDVPIRGLAVGPDGSLYAGGEGMLARYRNGVWQSWTVRDRWSLQGGLYVDPAGIVWAGVLRDAQFEQPATLRLEVIE